MNLSYERLRSLRSLRDASRPPTKPFVTNLRHVLFALLLGFVTCPAWAEEGHLHDDHAHDDQAQETKGGKRNHKGEDHEVEAINISPEVLEEFGIRLRDAGAEKISRTVTLPAEIRANEDRLAHITPRFAGIVKSVNNAVGDRVEAGHVLAVIESSGSLAPYPLKTELAGVVIAKHITRGEPVTRESEAFVIADLDDVWVDISAYQKDFAELQIGQAVLISAGHGREEAEGQISYISPIVDEETRTATARVVLPNSDRVWRPGMFVTARILVEDVEVPVAVPLTAIEVVEGQEIVFVETSDGFRLRPIETGRKDEKHVQIVSGLRPDERYVAQGGFTLKAELAREDLSGGHSH